MGCLHLNQLVAINRLGFIWICGCSEEVSEILFRHEVVAKRFQVGVAISNKSDNLIVAVPKITLPAIN